MIARIFPSPASSSINVEPHFSSPPRPPVPWHDRMSSHGTETTGRWWEKHPRGRFSTRMCVDNVTVHGVTAARLNQGGKRGAAVTDRTYKLSANTRPRAHLAGTLLGCGGSRPTRVRKQKLESTFPQEQEDTLTVQIRAPEALPGLVARLSDLLGAAATAKAAHSFLGQGLVEGTRRPAFLSQACCLLAMQPPAREAGTTARFHIRNRSSRGGLPEATRTRAHVEPKVEEGEFTLSVELGRPASPALRQCLWFSGLRTWTESHPSSPGPLRWWGF
nr:uncharacterized protein LOC131752733 [Kogia breviceps]